MKRYELRDPIHKRITFDDFERDIIDHPFFQRLRFISQLSFLQTYVYPGGVHDRFSHSLGAMHVAGRLFGRCIAGQSWICDQFSKGELDELRRRIRLAGLLHDIGHGPFSHSSESVFPTLSSLPINSSWWRERDDRQSKHEDYSVLLIQELALQGVIEMSLAQDVASLVHGEILPSSDFSRFEERIPTLHRVLKSMISGEVDCDRMDYLLRDSYYCGVAYGHYDIDWLISSMSIAKKDGKLILAISDNGVRAFEDFLLARYHMIDQVYFHKTKAGFTHYLEQAIAKQEIQLTIPSDPREYARLRDGHVIELLFSSSKNEENYWSHHLMNRIPAKRILRLHEKNSQDVQLLQRLKIMCEKAGIRHFSHSVKSELSHLGEGLPESATLYVAHNTLSGVEYVPMSQYSGLLQSYNDRIEFTDFFVIREDFDQFQTLTKVV
jgi:uncharacterized protein